MTESFAKEVWETFTAIDVKPMMEKNGNTDYITWSRIWEAIMGIYPDSAYFFEDRRIPGIGDNGPTETVEVSCTLTIQDDMKVVSKTMHLPVMTSRVPFNAIEMPTSRNISDSKMRCLVKCAAMHGLGLSLWSGDDTYKNEEDPHKHTLEFAKLPIDYRMALYRTADVIKQSFINDDQETAVEAWRDLSEEEMKNSWLAVTKGGFYTMEEKKWLRAAAFSGEEE